ncbi:hypothetical protein HK102_001856 [Quaeritorhiza haematococci]|nr:hypothetical protein HK102_001856 [Quaeritorhiza haematococci]
MHKNFLIKRPFKKATPRTLHVQMRRMDYPYELNQDKTQIWVCNNLYNCLSSSRPGRKAAGRNIYQMFLWELAKVLETLIKCGLQKKGKTSTCFVLDRTCYLATSEALNKGIFLIHMTPFRDVQKLDILRNVNYIKNQTYYLLDPAGVVIGLEKNNMERFHMSNIFDCNGGRFSPRTRLALKDPGTEDILGKPIYDFIQGVPFANIHKKLLQLVTRTFPIRFLWYSDSSTLERQMHTTISCIHHQGGDLYSILYAVEIVYERQLEHVQDYLDFPIKNGTTGDNTLKVCSFCKQVHLPPSVKLSSASQRGKMVLNYSETVAPEYNHKYNTSVFGKQGKKGYQSYKDTGDDIWLVAKMWKQEKDKITIQNMEFKVVYDICNWCRDEWDFFFTQVEHCYPYHHQTDLLQVGGSVGVGVGDVGDGVGGVGDVGDGQVGVGQVGDGEQ